jgi:hypothetical protein
VRAGVNTHSTENVEEAHLGFLKAQIILDKRESQKYNGFMTPREWKNFAIDLIDGLERQLCSSAPKTARLQLAELRECASKATTVKARKSCEQRLDKLVESTPFFRAAARRHVGERADIAIDGIERSLERMINLARVRGDKRAERRIAKILADFRKNRRKPIYKPIKKR